MADRLVAVLAYTDKVALPVAVCICIPDVQRPFRCILDMVDVMDQVCAPVSPALLADLHSCLSMSSTSCDSRTHCEEQ